MDETVEVGDVDAGLFHGVAVAQGDGVVFQGLVVDGDAERCADCILTAVALADGILFVVVGGEVKLEIIDNLAGFFGKSVLAHEGHHGALHGSQGSREVEHHARVAALEFLFLIGRREYGKEHTVNAD